MSHSNTKIVGFSSLVTRLYVDADMAQMNDSMLRVFLTLIPPWVLLIFRKEIQTSSLWKNSEAKSTLFGQLNNGILVDYVWTRELFKKCLDYPYAKLVSHSPMRRGVGIH